MSEVAWLSFLAVTAPIVGFFFLAKRHFDFLTIACIGAVFYFSPLLWGTVLQVTQSLSPTIQPPVYLIAAVYFLALMVAAIASDRFAIRPKPDRPNARSLSEWYLIVAALGLLGAIYTTKGALFNVDKLVALQHIGYFYVAFEMAASLACISAVMERRWWLVAASCLLLAVDLLVGIRAFVVLTALSVSLVLLIRDGRVRLLYRAPSFGVAGLLLIVAMLFVHSTRPIIFERVAEFRAARSATVAPVQNPAPAPAKPAIVEEGPKSLKEWAMLPLERFQESEPFIVQGTLVGVVETGLSCKPSNILKSLYLIPGLSRIFPNTYPPTFFDEYQPILYPNLPPGGLGGNIWAEMLCRFGYAGVAIFGVLMIAVLVGLSRLLPGVSPTLQPPLAFGGVIIAFYINRNDLHYTLVLLKQMACVFAIAWALSWLDHRWQAQNHAAYDSAE